MAVQTVVTRAEFRRLPEGPPFFEYEYGQVIEMPRPHPWHNRVVLRLAGALDRFVAASGLGEVFMDSDVDLSQDLVYAPDIAFIRHERLAAMYHPVTGEIAGIPDLVVEVVSPSHPDRDRISKFAEYERVGVEWLWLVDTFTLAVEEYHLEGGRYIRVSGVRKGDLFRPGIFPGLELDVARETGEPPRMLIIPDVVSPEVAE